jgi:hypothetical protein
LEVRRVRVAAAAVVSTAAQLTGLRSLRLFGFKEDLKRMDPALLQLTALTDLTALELQSDRHLSGCLDHWGINLHSKVGTVATLALATLFTFAALRTLSNMHAELESAYIRYNHQ